MSSASAASVMYITVRMTWEADPPRSSRAARAISPHRSIWSYAVTAGVSPDGAIGAAVDAETRRQMIAEIAYLRAEARGFTGGNPEQDWLEAEKEINRLLMQ